MFFYFLDGVAIAYTNKIMIYKEMAKLKILIQSSATISSSLKDKG